ncbi:hypothetical protein BJV74DRAFT_839502 [Russula compacta]|nr:hypothetical protein BJV74DRAFT_839502 [Russula compacta]
MSADLEKMSTSWLPFDLSFILLSGSCLLLPTPHHWEFGRFENGVLHRAVTVRCVSPLSACLMSKRSRRVGCAKVVTYCTVLRARTRTRVRWGLC